MESYTPAWVIKKKLAHPTEESTRGRRMLKQFKLSPCSELISFFGSDTDLKLSSPFILPIKCLFREVVAIIHSIISANDILVPRNNCSNQGLKTSS